MKIFKRVCNAKEEYKSLENIVDRQGYKIYQNWAEGFNSVNHNKNIITTYNRINYKENILLSHEIGHIYFWKIEKYFRFIAEIIAWIIGYIVCKRHGVSTQDYWSIAKKCLNTYRASYFKKEKEVI